MLRDYQIKTIKELFATIRQGNSSVLVVVPCGGGKSTIFSKVCEICEQNDKKVLFVVHSRKLVSQFKDRLKDQFGIGSGTIMAGVKENRKKNIQVASIMSLNNREKPDVDVVIIDEAHRSKSNTYIKLVEMYKDKVIIGLTATPERLDGSGLGDIFKSIINPVKMNDLISQGFLVSTKMYAPVVQLDFSGVSVKRGDYDENELYKKFNETIAYTEVVRLYQKHAEGKRAISFNINRDHAQRMVDVFNKAGVPSAYIDGDTPDDERDWIINKFRSREILHIANIAVFIEGVDIPEAEAVILNRKTKSKMYFVQMIGRVQRPDFKNGKTHAIVLDMGQNYIEHGFVEDYDLAGFELYSGKKEKGKAKKQEPKTKDCEHCGFVNPNNAKVCSSCNTAFKVIENDVEIASGVTMKLVDRDALLVEQIRQKPYNWVASRPIGYLLLIQYVRGFKNGWAVHKLKEKDEKYASVSFSQAIYLIEKEEAELGLTELRKKVQEKAIGKGLYAPKIKAASWF